MLVSKNRKYSVITNNFRKWYFSQPYGKIKQLRTSIINQCDIDTYKFSNWLQGKSTPNHHERKIINQIAETNIF